MGAGFNHQAVQSFRLAPDLRLDQTGGAVRRHLQAAPRGKIGSGRCRLCLLRSGSLTTGVELIARGPQFADFVIYQPEPAIIDPLARPSWCFQSAHLERRRTAPLRCQHSDPGPRSCPLRVNWPRIELLQAAADQHTRRSSRFHAAACAHTSGILSITRS